MREVINEIYDELLNKEMSYAVEEASDLTKKISEKVKEKLKGLELPQYKYVVQVILGEKRCQGVHMGCRLLWDEGTDCQASAVFSNDMIFCVTTTFGIYQY